MSHTLLLFSTILFGLAVRPGPMTGVAALLATLGLTFSLYLMRPGEDTSEVDPDLEWEKRLLFAVLIFGLFGSLGWAPSSIVQPPANLTWLSGTFWILAAVAFFAARGSDGRKVRYSLVASTLAFTFVVGVLHLDAASGVGFDVLFLHAEAAEAMANGLNPYTDAVVVFNGAPAASPGDVITGYVYPPVTAVLYSIGHWLLSDPRWISLIAWLVFLGTIGVTAAERGQRHVLYVMLMMAAIPGWTYVLTAAWTEPTSLALLAATLAFWKRPIRSGALLGLALASKQYFAVATPLIFFRRVQRPIARAVSTVAVIGLTVGVALVWDAGAFWSAAVEFHTTTPLRPDSSNLVGLAAALGLTWDPPTVLTVGVGLLTASMATLVTRDRQTFGMALALTLAVSFLVSSQAFANYWFLVAGICGLAVSAPSPANDLDSSDSESMFGTHP